MRTILAALLMVCAASAAHATQQVPERLVYGGITNDMYTTPLESLFSADNPKPKLFWARPSSTACWRGYVGTWKIENDCLYLIALQEGHPSSGKIPLDKVNPEWVAPVKAIWFTGTIQIGKGGGRGMVIRDNLEVKNGKVVPTWRLDNTEQKEEAAPESGRVRK